MIKNSKEVFHQAKIHISIEFESLVKCRFLAESQEGSAQHAVLKRRLLRLQTDLRKPCYAFVLDSPYMHELLSEKWIHHKMWRESKMEAIAIPISSAKAFKTMLGQRE